MGRWLSVWTARGVPVGMVKVCPKLAAVQRARRDTVRCLGAIGEFLVVRLTALTVAGSVGKWIISFDKAEVC
jgi:hypothetical protein